ncbi:MAG: VWA domain-containing protein [Candidatus Omnitrophica bacterium]|nr:VWA domain-containing protein [Candidatus Omnitrophota bacterium]
MQWGEPKIFYMLWSVGLLGVFFWWAYRRRKQMWNQFAVSSLHAEIASSVDSQKMVWKNIFLLLVLFLSLIAAARPQWGFELEEVRREGVDILLAIDTSKSMLTEDVKPNRLERTKLAVRDLLKKLKGDRLGIIAFAGNAFMVCPLTVDYDGIVLSLEDLDTQTIPKGGTNVGAAIAQALDAYKEIPSEYKVLVLLTDGDNLEGDPLQWAKKAKDAGLKIYSVGIGTKEGELVRIQDESGKSQFLKDQNGNFVKSRLNERLLQEIALSTGGAYVRASGAQFGLDLIYDQHIAQLEKRQIDTKTRRRYFERFQIPLGLAVLFLILEPCIMTRRPRTGLKGKFLIVILSLFLFNFSTGQVFAASKPTQVQQGNSFYKAGDYNKALEKYRGALQEDPESDIINYDAGTGYYKSENYLEAIAHLEKSLLTEQLELKEKVHYNLGNSFYKLGQQVQKREPQTTISSWEKSLRHYEDALELTPNDHEAKENYEFVKKELEKFKKELEQKQKQQKQNSSQQRSEQKSEEQQGQDKQQEQGQSSAQDQKEKKEGSKAEDQKQDASEGQDQNQGDTRQEEESLDDFSAEKEPSSSDSLTGQMSQREAQKFLEQYQDNEQPQGLLNIMRRRGKESPVLKDW